MSVDTLCLRREILSMATTPRGRIPNALIPSPHGRDIPPGHGLPEEVEAAAVLLGKMYPSQAAKRLVAHYECAYGTAYEYIARARAFLAGLRLKDRETIFHETSAQLDAIILNPVASEADRLKAIHLKIGLHGLRRAPEPPPKDDEEVPMFDRSE